MARKKTTWLRRFIFLILLLLLLAPGAGWLYWQHLREHWGIEHLKLEGIDLGFGHLQIDRIYLSLISPRRIEVQVVAFQLDWRAAGGLRWQLDTLQMQTLDVHVSALPGNAPEPTAPDERNIDSLDPHQWLPSALPQRIIVRHVNLDLPCASGRCQVPGSLHYARTPQPTVQLKLERAPRQLQLRAWIPSGPIPTLQMALEVDDQPLAELRSSWQAQAASNQWSGRLHLPAHSDNAWLLEWLEEGLGRMPSLEQAPGALRAEADWLLQLPAGPLDLQRLIAASGHIDLSGELPTPWPVPGIGEVQGTVVAQLLGERGTWQAREVEARVQLPRLDPQWLSQLPSGADPGELSLQLRAESLALSDSGLPVEASWQSSGPLELDGKAALLISTDPSSWSLQLSDADLRLRAPNLQAAPWRAQNLRATLKATGELDADGYRLEFKPGSQATLGTLQWTEGENRLQLHKALVQLSGLQANSDETGSMRLGLPLKLAVERFEQAHLHTLGWTLQGQLGYTQQALTLEGILGNSADLSMRVKLARHSDTSLQLDAQLPPLSFSTGNPLAHTLSDWPETLELSTGTLQLDARLQMPAEGPLAVSGTLQLAGVAGILDRSELSGLDARLQARLQGQKLQLDIPRLDIASLNPGLPLQAIHLQGSYQAPLDKPANGLLDWQRVEANLFGGRLWLEPAGIALTNDNPPRSLHIEGLDLEQVLVAYPTEGLHGAGTLDGELPLQLTTTGLSIVGGQLGARAPGGRLHFSSPKLSSFGASNPAMGLVVQALENFHYSRLESGVNYDEQGTLRLALRLEGQNPQIENGRPINFNINIEEDIPALLTSLQLSGKVSERIQQRVQERMRKAEQATP